MATVAAAGRDSRATLRSRVEARREELEQATRLRVAAIADTLSSSPAYGEGLRRAIGAALDYGLASIDGEESQEPPIPIELLAQARIAARSGIELDTILRRYFAGGALLAYFMIDEASRDDLLSADQLQPLIGALFGQFDRMVSAVSEEHKRELRTRGASVEERRVRLVERLLSGEVLDASALGYDLAGHHLGAIAYGEGAACALRELAAATGRRLLLIRPDERSAWGWLGGRVRLSPTEVFGALSGSHSGLELLAVGEAGSGADGWRLTHRQAAAAAAVGTNGAISIISYGDVALVASAVCDDLLLASLRQMYLAPLAAERDGETARRTLRAYFEADCNSASAAAALAVSRQTVNNRLRAVEDRLGRPVRDCTKELEIALRLEELGFLAPPSADGRASAGRGAK